MKNKSIAFRNITDKFSGKGNFNADLIPGESIRIFGDRGYGENPGFDKTFRIGDLMKSVSYNLIYTDPIVGFTAKNVIYKDCGQSKRMPIEKFIMMNWDFDLERIRKYNAIESMNI